MDAVAAVLIKLIVILLIGDDLEVSCLFKLGKHLLLGYVEVFPKFSENHFDLLIWASVFISVQESRRTVRIFISLTPFGENKKYDKKKNWKICTFLSATITVL